MYYEISLNRSSDNWGAALTSLDKRSSTEFVYWTRTYSNII